MNLAQKRYLKARIEELAHEKQKRITNLANDQQLDPPSYNKAQVVMMSIIGNPAARKSARKTMGRFNRKRFEDSYHNQLINAWEWPEDQKVRNHNKRLDIRRNKAHYKIRKAATITIDQVMLGTSEDAQKYLKEFADLEVKL